MTFICPIHGYYEPVQGTTVALCPMCSAAVPQPPQPPSSEPHISGIPISKFGTHDALVAKLNEVTDALEDLVREGRVDGLSVEGEAALDDPTGSLSRAARVLRDRTLATPPKHHSGPGE